MNCENFMEDNRGFRNTAWSQQPTKKKVLQYMAIMYFSHIYAI